MQNIVQEEANNLKYGYINIIISEIDIPYQDQSTWKIWNINLLIKMSA
jgi:hypothetical protein